MQYNITLRQKDKGWQYIISYKNEDGKWKQKSKQGFAKRKDAKDAAESALDELKDTIKVKVVVSQEYTGITFKEFTDMFTAHEKLYKTVNTLININTAVNRFSDLNKKPMVEIEHMDIQKCIDKMIEDKLRLTSIKKYFFVIKYIFNQAVAPYEILSTSPIRDIKLPEKTIDNSEKEQLALNARQKKQLLDYLNKKSIAYSCLCSLALASGLRLGELLGLTWDDIDLKEGLITVSKQWKLSADGSYSFGMLKKKNSYRVVPISKNTINTLVNYKENKKVISIDNRIFKMSNHNTVQFMLRVSEKMGFHVSMHVLRHTYATDLIGNGIDFKTAAALLGHDVEMTMKIYSHVTDDMMELAAKKINAIF